MLHWIIWEREPGVHEAIQGDIAVNLFITLLSIFIYISYSYLQIQYIDAINVPFCILQQLLKLTATNLNAKMTSAYKILPHPHKYPWCVLNNIIGSYNPVITNSMSVSTGVSNISELRYSHRNNEGDSGQVTSQAME